MFGKSKRWLVPALLLLATGTESLRAARPWAGGMLAPCPVVRAVPAEPIPALVPMSISQIPTCVFGFRVTIQSRNARHDEISRQPLVSCCRG